MVNFHKILNKELYLYYEIEYYVNHMLKVYPHSPITIHTYETKGLIKFYCYPRVPRIIFNIVKKNFELQYWLNSPRKTQFRIRILNDKHIDKTIVKSTYPKGLLYLGINNEKTISICPICKINIYPIRKIKTTDLKNKKIKKLNMKLHIRDHQNAN